jgi:Tol biopolymer transport system component
MRLEELGEVALSPDGRWLAYVVKRPRATAQFHHSPFLFGGDRGDIWLFDTASGEARNLTGGEVEGSGYWGPSWSADSARLAMLSTTGGNIHVWGCEVASGSLARL